MGIFQSFGAPSFWDLSMAF